MEGVPDVVLGCIAARLAHEARAKRDQVILLGLDVPPVDGLLHGVHRVVVVPWRRFLVRLWREYREAEQD